MGNASADKCLYQQKIPVLTNAYTLSPVPGSIIHAGMEPRLIDCNVNDHQISLESLKDAYAKIIGGNPDYSQTNPTKPPIVFLLSYMRSRVPPELDEILEFVQENNLLL